MGTGEFLRLHIHVTTSNFVPNFGPQIYLIGRRVSVNEIYAGDGGN